MTLRAQDFPAFYAAVNGYAPFPWQAALAERVWSGDWPRALALPTAAGKTTCLDVAVFALAGGAPAAARRIFFVVDRRIVVDQAFDHAQKLAHALDRAEDGIVRDTADRLREKAQPGWLELTPADRLRILRKRWEVRDERDTRTRLKLIAELAADERDWFEVSPLDVYALRGGMYRETAWARSPLQPTVIASTVDQVGSRLLFRGYGVSDGARPIHAGLVGNDSLILLDEAHCARPFDQTMQAVSHYRRWNDSPAPFHFVSVTATPSGDVPAGQIVRDSEADRAHPVLGKRIKASKPAKLVTATKATGKNWRKELVAELAKQARALKVAGGCVGIIVNRVATARDLRAELEKDAKGEVVLLTGRMRPLDRDLLFRTRLKSLLSTPQSDAPPPLYVIGTQALEVGADFDFHALVTECASLDALRQRFGRLNRVANRTDAPAVVVVRGDQADLTDRNSDAVYGESLSKTWKWLNGKAPDGVIDFGFAALNALIGGEDTSELRAPSSDAPVLFPVHLDCWVQTRPRPEPDPDPAPFLHGPKEPGEPDVQVVFRNDLVADAARWAEIVALCPPSSSEAVPVRIGDFRRWLAGASFSDQSTDLTQASDTDAAEETTPREALRWKGAEEKETGPVTDPKEVRPGDLFVVSCSENGVHDLGDFPDPSQPPADYAEEAFQRSRDKAVLRIPAGDGLNDEDDDFETKLSEAIRAMDTPDAPEWKRRAARALDKKEKRLVEKRPGGGWVVTGKRRLKQFDPEFLDDAASSYNPARRAVTLAEHSSGVAARAAAYAAAAGLPAALYAAAGYWHDLGKLDARFQKLLKGYAAGEPLAKSGSFGTRPWEAHRYPKGARHELLSAALLAGADDLFLHLIATHHGHARPFAPAVDDPDADARTVPCAWLGHTPGAATQDVAAWNGALPNRFWRVVRGYGWWGTAYREALFRLADHAQSRAEEDHEEDTRAPVTAPTPVPPGAPPAAGHALPLPGLDGANPLAFLAAVGTLRLAAELYPAAALHWEQRGGWRPVLTLPERVDEEAFAAKLHARVQRTADPTATARATAAHTTYREFKKKGDKALDGIKKRKLRGEERETAIVAEVLPFRTQEAEARREWLRALEQAVPASFLSLGQSINASDEEFAEFAARSAEALYQAGPAGRADADFPPAFGSEACLDRNCRIIPTEFQLITGSGHQFFLSTWAALMGSIRIEQVRQSLFGTWTYSDRRLSFRWDPVDDVRYAVCWADPSSEGAFTEHGANLLAAFGIAFFPVMLSDRGPRTTGFVPSGDEPYWTWPLWKTPCVPDVVRSMLAYPGLHAASPKVAALGDVEVFRVRKFEVGTPPLSKLNLRSAVMV